jgi:hypothetical protein
MTKATPEEQPKAQKPKPKKRTPRGDDGPKTLVVNIPPGDPGAPPPNYNDNPKPPRRGKTS